MSSCGTESIKLRSGQYSSIPVSRFSAGVATDCTGWTVSAVIKYVNIEIAAVPIAFEDESTCTAVMEFSDDLIDLIDPTKGCIVLIEWRDTSDKPKVIRVPLEVVN